MNTVQEVRKKLPTFTAFLTARGAEVLEPTNEWELLRFKTGRKTVIVYFGKTGRITCPREAKVAWDCFTTGGSWRAEPRTARQKMSGKIPTIRKRDGDLCFFCQLEVGAEDESTEHLVPRAHGGPDHLSNLLLAHTKCNLNAGHLSALEKIAMHVAARMKGIT